MLYSGKSTICVFLPVKKAHNTRFYWRRGLLCCSSFNLCMVPSAIHHQSLLQFSIAYVENCLILFALSLSLLLCSLAHSFQKREKKDRDQTVKSLRNTKIIFDSITNSLFIGINLPCSRLLPINTAILLYSILYSACFHPFRTLKDIYLAQKTIEFFFIKEIYRLSKFYIYIFCIDCFSWLFLPKASWNHFGVAGIL